MNFYEIYGIAYILDLILGDPHWFPHPVRFIGKLIELLEKLFYRFKCKRFFGGVMAVLVIGITAIISYYIAKVSVGLEIFFLYTTLATKSLGGEGLKIYRVLKSGDLNRAKSEISYLVSRDTESMDEVQIVRSTLETIAENSVDGVIAPMFYGFLGALITVHGVSLALPFAMGYKAVNTLDSMVGYKNEKYIDFGMVSARIDDLFNLVPARIAGMFIIPMASFFLGNTFSKPVHIFYRDRLNHSSPNSGHPEAAFAGSLGVQFGGKTSYFGKFYNKPTIGDKIKEFQTEDIKRAFKLMYMSSFVALITFGIIYMMIGRELIGFTWR